MLHSLLSRRTLWGVAFVLSLCVMFLLPEGAEAGRQKRSRRHHKRPKPGKVVVIGSSSVNGALGSELVKGLKAKGFTVVKKGRGSSGLARPDFYDWRKEIDSLKIDRKTSGAVVYLGTNDAQAQRLRPSEARRLGLRGKKWVRWQDPRWLKLYTRRAETFARLLCAKGVHRVAFIAPLDVRKSWLRNRIERIRVGLYRGARKVKCAHAFTGRGDLKEILRERRHRGKRGRRQALRQPDGTHLTRAGARRVWKRLGKSIVSWIDRGPVRKHRRVKKRRRHRRHKKRVVAKSTSSSRRIVKRGRVSSKKRGVSL